MVSHYAYLDCFPQVHSLERRARFLKPRLEFLREEEVAYGWPFREPPNLISHPSMFFGTHESNRNCPRTLWAFMLVGWSGRKEDLSLCSSCEDDGSLLLVVLWYGAELGKKKWSLGPVATLLRLWLEFTAAFWRSHINSEISSCVRALSPCCRIFCKWTDMAFSRKLEMTARYCIGLCV